MVEIKTDAALLDALHRAAGRKTSNEEVEKQRLSFILSTIKENGSVTKSRIKEVLAQQEGVVAA